MRTTVRIDDDLMRQLKERAHREKVSLSHLINRELRRGLAVASEAKIRRRHREKTFALGSPALKLEKALSLAAALEDEEVIEEMARRK